MSSTLVFEAIFNKPGSDWMSHEIEALKKWLYESRQEKYLLLFALKRLGKVVGTSEEAKDAWQDFAFERLDGVIKNYDPSRKNKDPEHERQTSNALLESPFGRYLVRCLSNFCSTRRGELERRYRTELPITRKTADGQIIDLLPIILSQPFDAEDELGNPLDTLVREQEDKLLQECLRQFIQQLEPRCRIVLELKLAGWSHRKIAKLLRIKENASRARLYYALQGLRKSIASRCGPPKRPGRALRPRLSPSPAGQSRASATRGRRTPPGPPPAARAP